MTGDVSFVAVSGTRQIGWDGLRVVTEAIAALPVCVLIVGGAKGVDVVAAEAGMKVGHWVHLVLPAAPHSSLAEQLCHSSEYVHHVAANNAGQYRRRNQRMVDLCDRLIAFPLTEQEVLRSGTWMAIRMARRAGKPIDIHPLERKP